MEIGIECRNIIIIIIGNRYRIFISEVGILKFRIFEFLFEVFLFISVYEIYIGC